MLSVWSGKKFCCLFIGLILYFQSDTSFGVLPMIAEAVKLKDTSMLSLEIAVSYTRQNKCFLEGILSVRLSVYKILVSIKALAGVLSHI